MTVKVANSKFETKTSKALNGNESLSFPALRINQGNGRYLYMFGVDGRVISSFSVISRVRRGDDEDMFGYQRPEVRSHIREIKQYLESDRPMVPNAVVVAFNDTVTFEAINGKSHSISYATHGFLRIPKADDLDDGSKPGWIVDGQQRLAAIRESSCAEFPLCVVGFIAPDEQEQREQFILVNSTKPLSKSLIYELLPETIAKLPTILERRRVPSRLSVSLNYDADSPFRLMIQTATNSGGIVKDNSILRMLESSLSDGALYHFRDPHNGMLDIQSTLNLLKSYWSAVAEVFAESWGESPRRSRLMHGVGIITMGLLMDAICDRLRSQGGPTREAFCADLEQMKAICHWSNGHWEFGPGVVRRWNELQNTGKDIQMLANYLLVQYKSRVWYGSIA